MYTEDELLAISGLQHFSFCQRQWALIHLERVWVENRLTAEGRQLHDKVHVEKGESRGELVVARQLPLRSFRLGLAGQSDAVEYRRLEAQNGDGAVLAGRKGRWSVMPVEYKRGRPKRGNCDRVQLCAQALCLEEMLGVCVREGALFYGEPRRRTAVVFDAAMRTGTESLAEAMQKAFRERTTPEPRYFKGCDRCSLRDRCMPEIGGSVSRHYRSLLAVE